MPKKYYVLVVGDGEYGDYTEDVVGIITDAKFATAFQQCIEGGKFEEFELNQIPDHYFKAIESFLDPKTNPMCECGHSLFYHNKGRYKSCKHNSKYDHNKHCCKQFTLKVEDVQDWQI